MLEAARAERQMANAQVSDARSTASGSVAREASGVTGSSGSGAAVDKSVVAATAPSGPPSRLPSGDSGTFLASGTSGSRRENSGAAAEGPAVGGEEATSLTRRPTKISFQTTDDRSNVKGRLSDDELEEILLGDPTLLEQWYRPDGDVYVLAPPTCASAIDRPSFPYCTFAPFIPVFRLRL